MEGHKPEPKRRSRARKPKPPEQKVVLHKIKGSRKILKSEWDKTTARYVNTLMTRREAASLIEEKLPPFCRRDYRHRIAYYCSYREDGSSECEEVAWDDPRCPAPND